MTGLDKNFTISVFPHELKKRLKILAADREQKLYEVVIDCLEIGVKEMEDS
jgi:predicted DNA-binding protein